MLFDLTLLKHPRDVRSRAVMTVLALGSAFALCSPVAALAQTSLVKAPVQTALVVAPEQTTTYCGPEVKEEVAAALGNMDGASDAEKLAVEADLYQKYQGCAKDSALVPPNAGFFAAARQCGAVVSQLGSLFYEEMSCCGYDPQRRQFACPVKIKQTFGFGGAPLPGSREHVLHCVADANGVLQPVGHDSVHLANALPGEVPTWQFAVIAAANQNLQLVQPMNGRTRQARSILSWGFTPNNCAFVPIWGNALNYRIRLDQ
jgi:hypothetical protein